MSRRTEQEQKAEIVAFVRQHWQEYTVGPSYREIADNVDITSSKVHSLAHQLIKDGVLQNSRNKARSLRLATMTISQGVEND